MKKIVKIVAIMAVLSTVFVGCKKPTDDPADNPTSEPAGTGTTTPTTPEGEEEAKWDGVIFNPATYEGDVGEVVDVNGEKYLKVTVNGYNTVIAIEELDLSKCTKFIGTAYAEEANANFNLTLKLADKDNADISGIPFYGIKTEVSTSEAGKAKKESWNEVSESMKCTKIQPMVQDSTANYAAQSGVVIYIGKIIAE